MSNQPEINQKKLILSTTEVSKLLLSKGRRKINESILSHGTKTLNNIDLTDLASQINVKLSKENENNTNNITAIGEQSMYKPFGDKSILYNKQRNTILDRSGFLGGVEKFNQKDINNNILSKLDKSQLGMGLEIMEQNPENKNKKKLLRLDSTEMGFDKNNTIKVNDIKNYYFPYDNENNLNLENSTKLKNFLVIFYFIIEKSTFVLIRKLDKKLIPLYFWNREEDAKKYGINYSQVNTPGLNFRTYENFRETFKNKGLNFMETIGKLTAILKEKKIEYEQNIEKIKNEYDIKIKELRANNDILNTKIDKYENDINIKDKKIKELTNNINDINEEKEEIKLFNEKLKTENKNLKNALNNINKNKENINNNNKNEEKKNIQKKSIQKSFFKSKTKLDLNKSFKLLNNKKSKNFSGQISDFNNFYENHISEMKKEKDPNILGKDEENYFPTLEEYNIDNDEEEKIDKIRTISHIKTYGERKNFYKNYNSASTAKNNFFISIKESSGKKEKKDLNSYKVRTLNKESEFSNKIPESKSSFSNKYDSQEESSND